VSAGLPREKEKAAPCGLLNGFGSGLVISARPHGRHAPPGGRRGAYSTSATGSSLRRRRCTGCGSNSSSWVGIS